jgi:hypothetical protein
MGLTLSKNDRLYPSTRDPDELAKIRALVHQLAHAEGLSIRGIRARLVDYHVWRSIGSISADLTKFECPSCATTPAEPEAASAARAEVYAWQ